MDKVTRKFRSHREAEEADRVLYRTMTPQERLNPLLELIARAHPHEAQPRLARVCRVTQLRGR
ncbi:MAG: hypothetical protein JNL97_07150 [Verrucomicrobiales bacterium]|nr:hypothetical protein [Verrucomicrobiales bacterium]